MVLTVRIHQDILCVRVLVCLIYVNVLIVMCYLLLHKSNKKKELALNPSRFNFFYVQLHIHIPLIMS